MLFPFSSVIFFVGLDESKHEMMKTLIFLQGLMATLHSGYGQSKKELLCRKWGMNLVSKREAVSGVAQ